MYKIKSHKFENWYKLFTKVNEVKITKIKNGEFKYDIYVCFDHGS